ncbi:MAG: DNA polymerase III subunit delta [Zymomonas mobilis subsp. pomaceae]|uniref:DNA-directed DNA polymerase n=1 Tax=Zymomonas mobilis subsp. pomaceae (strain ATCC 29192 / DSM 22645 / JCM 10191 / CCUG 17912 / NBRC 13757 / NCIMB 11200 / NRRL B-4491 / Barker I) TaxID=579138 RepID=F8EWB3_ZYMMT|nr:DNA polymerase III subunit delta [Zymomonas mobilis]AEI38523.1 DNA polymerase III delta [Zymomonas mobilis subsp. pomaceae ATCC 29192]MDX5948213.1 DNA polymerase III subunit delta [Zymomonas mobilis subsp. pomaceae]GEB88969.1 DNA polymerase III subunit delta [Zymomonas mobilis subsp. pomaceae]
MKSNRSQVNKAIEAVGKGEKVILLLYGPDVAQSRAIADQIDKIAPSIERIELTGAMLRNDPATLADEAASISLFSASCYVRAEVAGDEATAALKLLLPIQNINNSVIIITGNLKRDSKLLKTALPAPNILAYASYPPEGENAIRLVMDLGRQKGLAIPPDIAQRLVRYAENNCALFDLEIEKYALYLDASPDNIVTLDHNSVDLLSADNHEGNLSQCVEGFFSRSLFHTKQSLLELSDSGIEAIAILRILIRRALLLSELSAQITQGSTIEKVIEGAGKKVFWKEKRAIAQHLRQWRGQELGRLIDYLLKIERNIKQGKTIGFDYVAQELYLIISLYQ